MSSISDMLSTILPSFLTDKLAASSEDIIAWYYGFRESGTISRPVVGMTASAAALGGVIGVFIFPMVAVFLSFFITDRNSGALRGNPPAIFMAGCILLFPERTISSSISFLMRDYLIVLLFLWGIRKFGHEVLTSRIAANRDLQA